MNKVKTALPSRLRVKALAAIFAFGMLAQGLPSSVTMAEHTTHQDSPQHTVANSDSDNCSNG